MALANVAADLLARNRRVLMVDFDLEAPGLDTFPITTKEPLGKGLVDLIHDYLDEGEAPSILPYVYDAKIHRVDTGKLWLMPAGQNKAYDTRFKSIDWLDFYENRAGFLFFEDLKVQWEEELHPDYVLIDSRTGHTDIGGICTRQLPDCVVITFYPNEQNLRGLKPIVEDIREEVNGPLRKRIDLLFVMANVPDLDDEDQILAGAAATAQKVLGYAELAATIHHYNTLTMLEQRLMLIDRPNSKLATEYKELVAKIVRKNPEDRDGALALLQQVFSSIASNRDSPVAPAVEQQLERIRQKHPSDISILLLLAKIKKVQVKTDEVFSLLNQILKLDPAEAETLVFRAEMFMVLRQNDHALQDLGSVFRLNEVPSFSFGLAAKLQLFIDPKNVSGIYESPAVPRLPARLIAEITCEFQRRPRTIAASLPLIRTWMVANPNDGDLQMVRVAYTLSLIGSGQFEEAIAAIGASPSTGDAAIADAFNHAMATWGSSQVVPVQLFSVLVGRLADFRDDTNANRLQCFSIVYWATGDRERAKALLKEAVDQASRMPASRFSCWSYLERTANLFREDLAKMMSLYEGQEITPPFIERHYRNSKENSI
jgi:MinD-like ATPase involved in chromosome partitioning or flagellar assembly